MDMFKEYKEALEVARKKNVPLWDTHSLPWRYYVGPLTIEMEENEDNKEWEEVPLQEPAP